MNQHAEYLGQSSFRLKVTVRTDIDSHTGRSTWTTKAVYRNFFSDTANRKESNNILLS